MIAKEKNPSPDINHINGMDEHDDEVLPAFSPDSTACHSRCFHVKQKQCLSTNEKDTNGEPEKEILRVRSSSSPPPPALLATNENDSSKTNENVSNNYHAQVRPSLPTIYSGYQRTKSQSVKLTRLDKNSCPKKAVHFADDFGLDLSQMKIINTDELPFVPSEAFKHLQINQNHQICSTSRVKVITYMEPQFENPVHTPGFHDRVSRHKIVLEQANAIDNRIYGTIRLISFGLHKRIKIRLTTNNWMSFTDYNANYIENSHDGLCDRFSFTAEIDRHRICIGNTIEFCIGYESFGGPEYWDNNYQQNYRFNCFSRTIPDYSI